MFTYHYHEFFFSIISWKWSNTCS